MRSLRIEWPAPRENGMPGWNVNLYDAETGTQIMTAVRLVVVPGDVITATVTMFADENGEPVFDGMPPLGEDGMAGRPVDVEFIVTDMRIAEAQ